MALQSVTDRRLQQKLETNELYSNEVQITSPAVDATITVSAEGATTANTRDIVIQLTDSNGIAIDYVEQVEVNVYLDVARVAPAATGGSTGISDGGNGYLQTLIAKLRFIATSDATGLIHLDWLDTGTEVAFLGVMLPGGRFVMSSALTNA